jgi:putative acetyltransferase
VTVTIRPERPGDEEAIRDVHRAAFEQEEIAKLVDDLRASREHLPGLSLVAERDGRVVGHVILSRARLDARPVAALGPIGVLPHLQRMGVGTALMRAAVDAARAAGERLIVLLGHPWYYPRFGFVRASTLGMRMEKAVPDEAFMALELETGAAAGGGTFRFAPAFDDAS